MVTKAYVKAKTLWIMPYSLMSFLIKKKALGRYLNNICADKFIILSACKLKNLPIDMFYCNSILAAFMWKYTKEGHDYWNKLNTEYEETKALYQRKL